MLGLFKKKTESVKPKKKVEFLFNLNISLEGWQDSSTQYEFLRKAKNASFLESTCLGEYVVDSNGNLHKGMHDDLHVFNCYIDIDYVNIENNLISLKISDEGYSKYNDSLIFDKSGIVRLEGASLFPGALGSSSFVIGEPFGFLQTLLRKGPRQTLDGLYESLECPDEKSKINALETKLRNHTYKMWMPKAEYNFESIATQDRTRLKLLENAYKLLVSHQ